MPTDIFLAPKDNRRDLEGVLAFFEHDENLRKTVLGIFDALVMVRQSFYNPESPRKRDGLIVYTNYHPSIHLADSPLSIFSWDDELHKIPSGHSVHNPDGKGIIDALLYHNGAIEVDGQTGNVVKYQRKIEVRDADELKLSARQAGFDLAARKKVCGEEYTGIGTRHWTAYLATKVDPDLYILVLSRESEIINVFKHGRIMYSPLPSELNKAYVAPYDARIRNPIQLKLPFMLPSQASLF